MSKYQPLKDYLLEIDERINEVTLELLMIRVDLGIVLPESAYKISNFWINDHSQSHMQAVAWLEAGWEVEEVDVKDEWVRFIRIPFS